MANVQAEARFLADFVTKQKDNHGGNYKVVTSGGGHKKILDSKGMPYLMILNWVLLVVFLLVLARLGLLLRESNRRCVFWTMLYFGLLEQVTVTFQTSDTEQLAHFIQTQLYSIKDTQTGYVEFVEVDD